MRGLTFYFQGEMLIRILQTTLLKGEVREIFQGEMFIRILQTTLLQTFLEKILNLQVIVKINIDTDDNLSQLFLYSFSTSTCLTSLFVGRGGLLRC